MRLRLFTICKSLDLSIVREVLTLINKKISFDLNPNFSWLYSVIVVLLSPFAPKTLPECSFNRCHNPRVHRAMI